MSTIFGFSRGSVTSQLLHLLTCVIQCTPDKTRDIRAIKPSCLRSIQVSKAYAKSGKTVKLKSGSKSGDLAPPCYVLDAL